MTDPGQRHPHNDSVAEYGRSAPDRCRWPPDGYPATTGRPRPAPAARAAPPTGRHNADSGLRGTAYTSVPGRIEPSSASTGS